MNYNLPAHPHRDVMCLGIRAYGVTVVEFASGTVSVEASAEWLAGHRSCRGAYR